MMDRIFLLGVIGTAMASGKIFIDGPHLGEVLWFGRGQSRLASNGQSVPLNGQKDFSN